MQSWSRALLEELNISAAVVPEPRLSTAVAAVAARADRGSSGSMLPPHALHQSGSHPLSSGSFGLGGAASLGLAATQQLPQQLITATSAAPFDVRLEWKHFCT